MSYSAYVDLDRADLFKVRHVGEQPILESGRAGRVRRVRHLSGFRHSQRRRSARLLRGLDPLRIRAVQRGDRHGDQPRRGQDLHQARQRPGVVVFTGRALRVERAEDSTFQRYLVSVVHRRTQVEDGGGRAEPVYKIRMASSSDGIHWNKVNKDLIESRIEEDEAQASPDVFYANGKYHMFFCYRYSSHYRGKENGYRIGYASSTNLIDWVRDDAKAGIDVSEEGWDAEMISYPHVFELDGKTYLAYLGNQVGRHGFGLAVLDGKLE